MAAKTIADWLTQARQENTERGPDAEWVAEFDPEDVGDMGSYLESLDERFAL